MKKTITANISGLVFHIESDAYEKLNRYLNEIRSYFEKTEEVDEIISDIESRIAELFREMLKEEREVVTMRDVDNVIEIMGEPEQFADVDEDLSSDFKKRTRKNFRKLYRDPDDKVLGGVCSGIGHYFGIDGIWIRIAFLFAFFVYGVGFIPYIILWIIIPLAKTASDKLEMKGEPVTADSIGRKIKDEYKHFKKKVDSGNFSGVTDKIERFFAFLGGIIVYILKFVVKLFALLVILGSIFILFFISIGFFVGPDTFNMQVNGVNYLLQTQLIELVLDNKLLYYCAITALVLLIFIPVIALFYAAIKLLFNIKGGNKIIGFSLGALWVLSILLLIVSAIMVGDKFSNRHSETNMVELKNFSSDTLYLSSFDPEGLDLGVWGDDYEQRPIFIKDEMVYMKAFSVDVYPSTQENFVLKAKKKAFGDDHKAAKKNAREISYSYNIKDSILFINKYLSFPKSNGFRDQEMKISIGVPVGKVIYFSESSKDIIYDVENITNTWDYDMIDHYWKMTRNGLECVDCVEEERSE